MYYSFYLDANFSFIRRSIAGYVTEDKRKICAKEKLKDMKRPTNNYHVN